jgi:hypothetical protein
MLETSPCATIVRMMISGLSLEAATNYQRFELDPLLIQGLPLRRLEEWGWGVLNLP